MSDARRGGIDRVVVLSGGASNPLLLAGTADPTGGGGVVAPEGSIYMRFVAAAGETYVKTGAANTAWTLMGSASAGSSVLTFGADSISAGADTRFIPPGFDSATAPTASVGAYRAPRSGTMQNMRVRHNAANGNGNSIDYTLRINSVNTLMTATLASGAIGDASDLVNTVAVAAGDLIDVTAVKPLSIGSGNQDTMISMELV